MASFDIVSELDLQEVDNAINQANKEISQRFDFKGSKSSIGLDKEKKNIKIIADDDFKLRSIQAIIEMKLAKRKVDIRSLKFNATKEISGGLIEQIADLQVGISKEKSKELVKIIKETKLKVSCEIQEEKLRVSGKKLDDLQEVQSLLKEKKFDLPLQYVNYRN